MNSKVLTNEVVKMSFKDLLKMESGLKSDVALGLWAQPRQCHCVVL